MGLQPLSQNQNMLSELPRVFSNYREETNRNTYAWQKEKICGCLYRSYPRFFLPIECAICSIHVVLQQSFTIKRKRKMCGSIIFIR